MDIKSNLTIRQETAADFFAVENLTRDAFWNVYRPGCLEHYVLHLFRDRPEFIPELSLVLEREGEIIAHVMFAWSEILLDEGCPRGSSNRHLRMMTFGPISVRPDLQRQGYGKMLLDFALERAREMGAGCIAMCGNIRFYGKCGFVTATSKGVRYADDPDGDAPYFLIKELTPGFLDGVRGTYKDPQGYFVSEAETDEFDKRFWGNQFPPKQKLKLPGQLA